MWNFADGMLGPLFAIFAEKVGGDILDVAWAWAIYLIVTGMFVIIIGKYSDHHKKEKILVLGYFLTALFTFCYLFVATPLHLILVQAGLGLALSLSNPTWYALYDKYSNPKTTGTVWGLADGEGKILGGLAIIVGGLIVQNFSFDVLFITMGTIQLAAAFYQIQLTRQGKLV